MTDRRPTVLVVDDDATNRVLVVETLVPEGLDVVQADSGPCAVSLLSQRPFDVVLLDVRMPGMDGFAALQALRGTPHGADVPVVFLTAQRDLDTFDRARSAGASDFLSKPVRPTELLARVETLVRVNKLGSEVRAQLDEIRRQRDDLMRLHFQKERLAAFLIHDLKNPLSAMRLEAEVILRAAGMPPSAVESARVIRTQCDRLNQLILNLLDVAKADEGALVPRIEPFGPADLLSVVAADLARHATSRGALIEVAIDRSVPASVDGDADLLRRALENLVENALRHSPAGAAVVLRASATDEWLELRVCDRGPGIPPADAERVFDAFVQIDLGSSRTGRGLGLAFCRTAVEAQHGTIAVEPSPEGATFLIRMPLPGRAG